jgi:hypothetical protein
MGAGVGVEQDREGALQPSLLLQQHPLEPVQPVSTQQIGAALCAVFAVVFS